MPQSEGRKRLGKKLAVAGGSILVSLLVAEVGARLRFGSPLAERLPILRIQANPTRGWEMVPSETHYTYLHPVRVNALGLRGTEVEPKRPGERRVLALGDSLVYGQGVADDQTLPSHLERALADRDAAEWTVVNAGLRAYDTVQELALLEELGPEVEPDVVLLCWFRNDFRGRDIEATHEGLVDSGPIAFDTGNKLEGFDELKWHLRQLCRRSSLLMYAYDRLIPKPSDRLEGPELEEALVELAAHLDRFVDLAEGLGAKPVMCVIPPADRITDEPYGDRIDERALEVAWEGGLPALDLRPALRSAYDAAGELPILPFDGHYDANGNRVMADALASWLLEVLDGELDARPN